MSCLSPEDALALVDGRLDDTVASAIDRHVGECDHCRRIVAAAAAGEEAHATPSRVGRYELADAIGRGGMGVVFRARDTTLGRDVALKLIEVGSSDWRARALREARALASLAHPNVVAVHDAGEHDALTFIA